MKEIRLPFRRLGVIDDQAYEMSVDYSDQDDLEGRWEDIWSDMESQDVQLHTFHKKYGFGRHSHHDDDLDEVLEQLLNGYYDGRCSRLRSK